MAHNNDRPETRLVVLGALAITLGFVAWYAYPGLSTDFARDDPYNIHYYWLRGVRELIKSNVLFFSTYYRPLGGLFYQPLFSVFGVADPFPYRLVSYFLILLNVAVMYRFVHRLSGSEVTAACATAIGCIYPALTPIYFFNSAIYEILCFTFYFGALAYYFRIRSNGRKPTNLDAIVICVLYVAALNAKEMAVSLPLVVWTYEILYNHQQLVTPNRRWNWIAGYGKIPVLTSIISVAFASGRFFGPDNMSEFPAYRLDVSLSQYLATWKDFGGHVFRSKVEWSEFGVALLLLAVIGMPVILRSRVLAVAAIVAIGAALPVNFVPLRGGYVLYLPLVGWSVYTAVLLRLLCSSVIGLCLRKRTAGDYSGVVAIGASLVFMVAAGTSYSRVPHHLIAAMQPTHEAFEAFRMSAFRPEPGSCVLVEDIAYFEGNWDLHFITKLAFDDHTLRVAIDRGDRIEGECLKDFDYRLQILGTELRVTPKVAHRQENGPDI